MGSSPIRCIMSNKLQISELELKNFLSYGSEVVKLQIDNLGPVLILGDLTEEDGRSNGAGKSTLVTAIVWCLFGRTINNPSPGDKIINWDNGKDCYVKLLTADGWLISRTRNVDGHSELLVFKDNIDCTKSTNQNAQAFVDELFGLDYEIFVSSVFCGQFGKSFLEMTSVKRKEAIERVLGLDRINVYSEKLKEICQSVETEQKILRGTIETKQAEIERQNSQIEVNFKNSLEFDSNLQTKTKKLQQTLDEIIVVKSAITLPDLNKLAEAWAKYDKSLSQISEFDNKIANLETQIAAFTKVISNLSKKSKGVKLDVPSLDDVKLACEEFAKSEKIRSDNLNRISDCNSQIKSASLEVEKLKSQISKLLKLGGTTCDNCQQEVVLSHTDDLVSQLRETEKQKLQEIEKHKTTIAQLKATQYLSKPTYTLTEAELRWKHNERIDAEMQAVQLEIADNETEMLAAHTTLSKVEGLKRQAQAIVTKKKPTQSLQQARLIDAEYQRLEINYSNLLDKLSEVKNEVNPYTKIIANMTSNVADLQKDVANDESIIAQLDRNFQHHKYLYRAYSDRKMIKGWLLAELIPYFNSRISYYLTSFGLELHIAFDSTLSDSTDKWDYDFCSGGERKRIDLAIMFALYDLYVSIYGQQCNIMVLDEVDSRLDQQGVLSFTEIVHDIAKGGFGPSTIFVISHKSELKDLFATQLIIKKEGGCSKVEGLYSKDIA